MPTTETIKIIPWNVGLIPQSNDGQRQIAVAAITLTKSWSK